VAAQACLIAFAAAPGRIAIVTDAAACAGMPPGSYLLGGEPIELPPGDGVPPVRADGTLAGSALRMDAGVASIVAAGIGLPGRWRRRAGFRPTWSTGQILAGLPLVPPLTWPGWVMTCGPRQPGSVACGYIRPPGSDRRDRSLTEDGDTP
jgi:hypothetical protein